MNKLITTLTIILSMNICNASVDSLQRYDFTEKMSNCQKLLYMDDHDGYKIGSSHYGVVGHNNPEDFISECFGSNVEFNSFNMTGLDTETSCKSETIKSSEGCDYLTYVSINGNSIVAKNVNNTHSGFAILSCSSSGEWIKKESFCSERNSLNCKSQEINWENCSAFVPELPNNATKKASNNNIEYDGYANVTCKEGNLLLNQKMCNFGCENKVGENFIWSVGNNTCSAKVEKIGSSYYAKAKNGEKQTIIKGSGDTNEQINFFKGEVKLSCSSGNWAIKEDTNITCEKLTKDSYDLSCTTKDVTFKYTDSSEVLQYETIVCDWSY